MIAETFLQLLKDPGHWLFEVTTDLIIGGLFGAIVWPRIKAHFHHDDEVIEKTTTQHFHEDLEMFERTGSNEELHQG